MFPIAGNGATPSLPRNSLGRTWGGHPSAFLSLIPQLIHLQIPLILYPKKISRICQLLYFHCHCHYPSTIMACSLTSILPPGYLFYALVRKILKIQIKSYFPAEIHSQSSPALMIKICGGFKTCLQTTSYALNLGGDCFSY